MTLIAHLSNCTTPEWS